jgi:hypothetical protein
MIAIVSLDARRLDAVDRDVNAEVRRRALQERDRELHVASHEARCASTWSDRSAATSATPPTASDRSGVTNYMIAVRALHDRGPVAP